ncbi:hypothetical protein [Streptomyces yanii]|uniref:Uncharacterized protein n=1 Tax=Streptomyces yanii TaxID=78510 RepID=A0ABV5R2B8_9ACTN
MNRATAVLTEWDSRAKLVDLGQTAPHPMGLAVVSALVVPFSFPETLRLPLTRTTVLEK